MNVIKKVLHCTMLSVLSPLFIGMASPAAAVSIVNLDDEAHTIILHITGQRTEVTLAPNERFQRISHPIKVERAGRVGPALDHHASYAIWPGGVLALQRQGRVRRGRN